jgi:hypothetical protein
MYPNGELKDLARERQLVMRRIARHRLECVAHAKRVAQPLQWVNRTHGELRKVSSLGGMVAGPLGLFAIRMVTKRMGKLGALVRWGPLAYSVAKSFMSKPSNR